MAQNIKVAVRVRPFSKRELDMGCECAVAMDGASTTVTDDASAEKGGKTFTYDFSYWSHDHSQEYASQDIVWQDIGEVILKNALDGFNGSLFAYGQTGSGKTYSVLGSSDEPGVVPRAVQRIFEEKSQLELDDTIQLCVWVSYLEIYREHIHDLLCVRQDDQELNVMQHPKFGVYVPNLTEEACQTPEKVRELMEYGTKRRAIAATQMNATSSRSHAVFCIRVERLQGERPEPGGKDCRSALMAKINLIDLAGSERQSKTGAEGATLREGCSINKSLSALGMVIKELSEAHSKANSDVKIKDMVKSIPFRTSKLTFLLKESLAGNSRTYMIAAVSPAQGEVDETLSTLRFASSVKAIQTISKQNKDKKDEMIEQLQKELEHLRREGAVQATSEDIMEKERFLEDMKKTFSAAIQAGETLSDLRTRSKEHGLSQEDIAETLGVGKNTPYFLNMADCPTTAGKLIYYVPGDKDIMIGSSADDDLRFSGVGIAPKMCKVENKDDQVVTICKCSPEGRVVHDGRALTVGECRELKHGHCLLIGHSVAMKVCLPVQAEAQFAAHELLLDGLEQDWTAAESSPALEKIEAFVSQICNEMTADEARAFLRRVQEAAVAVDEANDITARLRPGEGFQFDITVTTGRPSQVVVHASQYTEQDGYKQLYLCSAEQFGLRLQCLRDFHFEFEKRNQIHVETYLNPWQDTHMEEIHHVVQELRAKVHHLGGDYIKGPTLCLNPSLAVASDIADIVLARASPENLATTVLENNDVDSLIEAAHPTEDVRSAGEISDLTHESKKNLAEEVEDALGARPEELECSTYMVASTEPSPSETIYNQPASEPVHFIDLVSSPRKEPDQHNVESKAVRQHTFSASMPSTPLQSSSSVTSPSSLGLARVLPQGNPVSSRFTLASQSSVSVVTQREHRVGSAEHRVGSAGPSRYARGRQTTRDGSTGSLRSPSGSLTASRLQIDPSQTSCPKISVPTSTARFRSLSPKFNPLPIQGTASRNGSLQVRVVPVPQVQRVPPSGQISPRGGLLAPMNGALQLESQGKLRESHSKRFSATF